MVTPEKARWIADCYEKSDDVADKNVAEALRDLADQVEALQADAARYRWLRNDPPVNLAVRRFPAKTGMGGYLDGQNLDEAIDAAREAK